MIINLNGDTLLEGSMKFQETLKLEKNKVNIDWYPYGILNNFSHLQEIFNEFPLSGIAGEKVLDIGGADGDLAFFLSSLKFDLTVLEHPPTNFNSCKGIHHLNSVLKDKIKVKGINLDDHSGELVSGEKYGLVFFLGILYHLKNPIQVLENLSRISRYLIVSTRIAKYANGSLIENSSIGYLLSPSESNGDATNWWIFSKTGLLRLFERSGWDVVISKQVGDLHDSNPHEMAHDERFFALLRSRNLQESDQRE
jgi:tRNA (mo5U34)-methyltransferase